MVCVWLSAVPIVRVPLGKIQLASCNAPTLPNQSQASLTYVAIGSQNEVEVVDATTGAVVGCPIPVGTDPVALDQYLTWQGADSQILVADHGSDDLEIIDAETNTNVAAISLPAAPTAVTASHGPTCALVLEPAANEVSEVNLQTRTVSGNLTTSSGLPTGTPSSITFNGDGSHAYVTYPALHKVAIIDWSSGCSFSVASTYTGSSSFDPQSVTVAANWTTAYVSDSSSTGVIDVVNVASGGFSISSSITLTGQPAQATVSQDLSTVYVAITGSADEVAVIKTSGDTVTYWSVPISAGPLALSHDGSTLQLGASGASTLDLLNTSAESLENSVVLDGTPTAVFATIYKQLYFSAYVADSGTNDIAVVDTAADTVRSYVSLGSNTDPVAVAVSPDGKYAYVVDRTSNSLSVLQTNLIGTGATVQVASVALGAGSSPLAVAVSPSGDTVLVADSGTTGSYAGTVSVIDTDPADTGYLTRIATIDVNGTGTSADLPFAVAFSPDGTHAYVVDEANGAVTVLQTATPPSGDSFDYSYERMEPNAGLAGTGPQGIAISPNDQMAYVTALNGYVYPFTIGTVSGQPGWLEKVPPTGTQLRYAVGSTPGAIILSPEGQTAWVVNSGSDSVSQLNTATGGVTTPITTSSTPSGEAITPDVGTYLEANDNSTVSVFNGSPTTGWGTPTNVSLETSADPSGLAVNPVPTDPTSGSLVGFNDADNPSALAVAGGTDVQDGVDTATGAYTMHLDDLSLPDIGLPLDLSQDYDSLNPSGAGPLGNGWTFSYGMSVYQYPTTGSSACDLRVTQENGSYAIFRPPAGSYSSCPLSGAQANYEPPPWEQATMSVVPDCYEGDACWDMTRDGTTQFLFDQPSGKLVFEQDLNGNRVTLAYNGSGQLSTVTAASGQRALYFNWTSGLISSVTDGPGGTGREVAFAYSGGNLTDVTLTASSTNDPLSHHWHFVYTSNLLTSWWSPTMKRAIPATALRRHRSPTARLDS